MADWLIPSQTSFTTVKKRTYLGRKHKRRKRPTENKPKTTRFLIWFVYRCSVKPLSRVQFFGTPRTIAYQAPPSMGFSRQKYWSALPFPSPGDLPDPGIEPRSSALQKDALLSEPPGKFKRVCCLPVRESNPSLLRDRWGYSPLWGQNN